jgi:hypothetical protein
MMDKVSTHFNLNSLFDLVSNPGFRTATITTIEHTRNQIRKKKISKILKNPLK